jgi:hypothetical protein
MSEGTIPTTSNLIVIVEKKTQKGFTFTYRDLFPLGKPYNDESESESENEYERSVRRGKTSYK